MKYLSTYEIFNPFKKKKDVSKKYTHPLKEDPRIKELEELSKNTKNELWFVEPKPSHIDIFINKLGYKIKDSKKNSLFKEIEQGNSSERIYFFIYPEYTYVDVLGRYLRHVDWRLTTPPCTILKPEGEPRYLVARRKDLEWKDSSNILHFKPPINTGEQLDSFKMMGFFKPTEQELEDWRIDKETKKYNL